jgi:hypothetical protein
MIENKNRDSLELQIIQDGINGDTTVLSELLDMLPDNTILAALTGDARRYMCQNCGGGFSESDMVFGDGNFIDVDLCIDCSN